MSARSLNKVQLIGNLTRDPELRFTPQGTAVCSFGLATNRSWTTDSGDRREETEFHRIVAWAKLAELCSQLLFKGRRAYVEGRLQTRKWTTQDGQPRSTTEVVIDDMIILDSKYDASGNNNNYNNDSQQGSNSNNDDNNDDYTQGPSDNQDNNTNNQTEDSNESPESQDQPTQKNKTDKPQDSNNETKQEESTEDDIPF